MWFSLLHAMAFRRFFPLYSTRMRANWSRSCSIGEANCLPGRLREGSEGGNLPVADLRPIDESHEITNMSYHLGSPQSPTIQTMQSASHTTLQRGAASRLIFVYNWWIKISTQVLSSCRGTEKKNLLLLLFRSGSFTWERLFGKQHLRYYYVVFLLVMETSNKADDNIIVTLSLLDTGDPSFPHVIISLHRSVMSSVHRFPDATQ